jgi:prolyl-tRNA synthetase
VAETHNDDYGLIWPITVAPYAVHLVTLGPEGSESRAAAERLYASLQDAGIEVLYDDRDQSAGVKFNDADLLGMPVRLTVARRGMKQNAVEMKLRDQKERTMVPFDAIVSKVQTTIESLTRVVEATAVEVPFKA